MVVIFVSVRLLFVDKASVDQIPALTDGFGAVS